ncbi:MAG: prolipoprotein diacylglyceryl transferase [Firmicutes bacterium]|nr:prolipoprotein diacylglyceryl transferase [Bacillota bacterium]
MFPYVNIAGRQLPAYGLCLVCGVLLAGLAALSLGRRCRVKGEDVLFCGMYSAVGGLIGAKLGYLLAHLGEITALYRSGAALRELLPLLTDSGFLSFGGLAGALTGFLLYCREFRCDRDLLASCLIPAAPLLLACCRVGCFCAGCCYGRPWAGPLAVVNTASPVGINGVALFPVQLLSAGLDLLLFLLLALPRRNSPSTCGRLLGCFLTLYSLGRFGVEFLRGDHLDHLWQGLSRTQWVCLPALALGLWLLYRERQKAA